MNVFFFKKLTFQVFQEFKVLNLTFDSLCNKLNYWHFH